MCDSRKRESICEGSKKVRSARKISRCARNDGMVYIAVCVIAENGKTFLRKEQETTECKEDFSLRSK